MGLKRILLVSPYDWSIPGGVNQHVFNLYQQLKKKYDVKILSPASKKVEFNNHVSFGKVISIPFMNGSTINITLDFRIKNKIKKFLNDFKPDIIHVHEPLLPLLNWIVIKHARCKIVGTFHAYSENTLCYSLFKLFLKKYWKKLDGMICVSQASQLHISSIFKSRYSIIPNGIDYQWFRKKIMLKKEPPKPLSTYKLLFIGRFDEPRKGLDYLLYAFKYLKPFSMDFSLTVVGDGDRYRFGDEFATHPHITWIGSVSHKKLISYLQHSDVLVAPSIGGESFGIILLEGMAAGIPVIAFDNPGYAGVITHEHNGMLVPTKDIFKLRDTILRVVSHDDLYMKLVKGGLTTAQHYDWKLIACRIKAFYNSM
ncbi:glycosyltransferase family 4 protein [Candidatus Margulisiibacteriota bacterium]